MIILTAFLITLTAAAGIPFDTSEIVLVVPADHLQVLNRWLFQYRELTPVRMADCVDVSRDASGHERVESCERLVTNFRSWSKDPSANPFYARGDFNEDGFEDFSVVLADANVKDSRKAAMVVVFNGPFASREVKEPKFILLRPSVSETFVGFGPPRAKPWHLVIGPPEAEGHFLVWRAQRYVLR